jgi:hypothetical protein
MSNFAEVRRLRRAERRIINREPWFQGIIGQSRWIAWPLGAPMGADGSDIYFDPVLVKVFDRYIEGFVLHEYLHNMCDHIARRGERECGLWNVAADYAINPIVTKLYDMPPSVCLLDADYAGLSPEVIYDRLTSTQRKIGAGLTVRLADMPADLSGEPLQRARQKWRDVIAAAGEPPVFLQAALNETIAGV